MFEEFEGPVKVRMEVGDLVFTAILVGARFRAEHDMDAFDYSFMEVEISGRAYESKIEKTPKLRESFKAKRQLKLEPLNGKTEREVTGSANAILPAK